MTIISQPFRLRIGKKSGAFPLSARSALDALEVAEWKLRWSWPSLLIRPITPYLVCSASLEAIGNK
jgi:hypothetical protein